jgi:hypothetical protein
MYKISSTAMTQKWKWGRKTDIMYSSSLCSVSFVVSLYFKHLQCNTKLIMGGFIFSLSQLTLLQKMQDGTRMVAHIERAV